MSDLPIHVMPEDESDNLDIDLEVIDDMISNDLILEKKSKRGWITIRLD